MLQFWIRTRVMDTRNHLYNRVNLKCFMKSLKIIFFLPLIIVFPFCSCSVNVEASVSLSVNNISFDSEGGTKDVKVTCNIAMEAIRYPDWITVTKSGNKGEQTFHLTASMNESNVSRTDFVTFTAQESTKKTSSTVSATISLTQSGKQ